MDDEIAYETEEVHGDYGASIWLSDLRDNSASSLEARRQGVRAGAGVGRRPGWVTDETA